MQLHTLLLTNHEALAVEEGERGETDLVQIRAQYNFLEWEVILSDQRSK